MNKTAYFTLYSFFGVYFSTLLDYFHFIAPHLPRPPTNTFATHTELHNDLNAKCISVFRNFKLIAKIASDGVNYVFSKNYEESALMSVNKTKWCNHSNYSSPNGSDRCYVFVSKVTNSFNTLVLKSIHSFGGNILVLCLRDGFSSIKLFSQKTKSFCFSTRAI